MSACGFATFFSATDLTGCSAPAKVRSLPASASGSAFCGSRVDDKIRISAFLNWLKSTYNKSWAVRNHKSSSLKKEWQEMQHMQTIWGRDAEGETWWNSSSCACQASAADGQGHTQRIGSCSPWICWFSLCDEAGDCLLLCFWWGVRTCVCEWAPYFFNFIVGLGQSAGPLLTIHNPAPTHKTTAVHTLLYKPQADVWRDLEYQSHAFKLGFKKQKWRGICWVGLSRYYVFTLIWY